MEPKIFYRLIFLISTACFIISFTSINFSHAPSRLLDCTNSSFSPLCALRNFLFNKQTRRLTKNDPKSKLKSHDHESDTPKHPLDPLTVVEIKKVRSILSSHVLFASHAPHVLHFVVLEEPDKNLVQNWEKGNPFPQRKASVIARVGIDSHVLTIDLSTGRVDLVDSPVRVSGYPMMTLEEMNDATVAPFSNKDFNLTIVARGINLTDVICYPISCGWFGNKEENSRVIKIHCYITHGIANFYMRPIEGLTLLFDFDTKQILEISDTGRKIPIPGSTNTDYRYANIPTRDKIRLLNPISIEQPRGASFVIEDSHLVKWANWEFHLKPDPRAGLIISQAMPLEPLNDCPRNAVYMDGIFAAADGTPYVRENMICVFESYAGDIGWRHSENPVPGLPWAGGFFTYQSHGDDTLAVWSDRLGSRDFKIRKIDRLPVTNSRSRTGRWLLSSVRSPPPSSLLLSFPANRTPSFAPLPSADRHWSHIRPSGHRSSATVAFLKQ